MIEVVNFLRGYLEVEIEGPYPERFLNICSGCGLSFWNLKRIDGNTLRARIRYGEYEALKVLAGRAMCTIRERGRSGAPFFAMRFKKRYVFLAGLILSIVGLYTLSLFVWDIEVRGNENVSAAEILRQLKDAGVKIGARTASVDTDEVKNEILLENDRLSWITVNIRGSRAMVEVRERIAPPVLVPIYEPCNVVAKKSGVIVSMDVLEGSPQVMVGETVEAGQLIVSGVIDSTIIGNTRQVHAMARLEAMTWYDLTAAMPADVKIKEYTGRTKAKTAIIIAGRRINLYFDGSISFEEYDKIISENKWALPGDVALPVTVVREEYLEYESYEGQIGEERAVSALQSQLLKRLAALAPGDVEKSFTTSREDGLLKVRLMAEGREDIGGTVKIPTEG